MCDTIAIVREDGVWFAKNSDRDPNEAQVLEWHPAAQHAPGATLRCTHLEIPQAARTHAVLVSRPFWMWGAEIGTNEHHVTIGNEAVFTRQRYEKIGLTGMDLLRLALERADCAKAAVETIGALLETHGQGGGCGMEHPHFTYHNSFIVADPRTAFVLETAGRRWTAERVTGVRTISNGLTIREFAFEHSDFLKTMVCECRLRQSRSQELAARVASLSDLFALLRDHGAGQKQPFYRWVNGCMNAPSMHGGGLVAGSQTTGSWVADLGRASVRHWVTGTAAPATSLFKPVTVDRPVDLGPAPNSRADAESYWWRHERFHRRVMRDPARLYPLFVHERDALEAEWLARPPESAEAFARAGAVVEGWLARIAREPNRDVRPWYVRRYWRKRNRRARLALEA